MENKETKTRQNKNEKYLGFSSMHNILMKFVSKIKYFDGFFFPKSMFLTILMLSAELFPVF